MSAKDAKHLVEDLNTDEIANLAAALSNVQFEGSTQVRRDKRSRTEAGWAGPPIMLEEKKQVKQDFSSLTFKAERPPLDTSAPLTQPVLLDGFCTMPHQQRALDQIRQWEEQPHQSIAGGIAAAEMGLGKTFIATKRTVDTWSAENGATLYVCNKSLMRSAAMDMCKFYGGSIRVLMYNEHHLGKRPFRSFNARTPFKNHVIVVTYDTIVSLANQASLIELGAKRYTDLLPAATAFFEHPWFRIIADESQRMSNPKSKVYQSMTSFKRGYRLCLTGTPMRNYTEDVFSQLFFCGYHSDVVQPGRKNTMTIQNYRAEGLGDRVFCMSVEDSGIQLPPRRHVPVNIDLDEHSKLVYNLFFQRTKDMVAKWNETKGRDASWMNVLQVLTRLQQICIACHLLAPQSRIDRWMPRDHDTDKPGGILGEPDNQGYVRAEEWIKMPDSVAGTRSRKISTVVTLISEPQYIAVDDKVLVFSKWARSVNMIHRALTQKLGKGRVLMAHGQTSDRDSVFAQFRSDPNVKVLVMTMIGATGLTLTEANHVILVEPHWNSMHMEQAAARVWRIGQTKPVTIWNLRVNNSVESQMIKVSERKKQIADDMLNDDDKKAFLNILLGED